MINATNAPFLAWIWTATILLTKSDLDSCPVTIHNDVIYVSTLLGKLKKKKKKSKLSPQNDLYWGLVLKLRKWPHWYTLYFIGSNGELLGLCFSFYLFIFLQKQVQCILHSDIFITSRILRLLLLQYIAWVNLLYVSFISSFPWRLNGSQQICYDPSRMLRVYETQTDNQTRPSIDAACWFTLGLWAILSLGLMFAQPLSDFITFRKHFINTLSSAIVGSRKANKPWFYPPCYCLWSDNHQCSQNSERCQKLKLR